MIAASNQTRYTAASCCSDNTTMRIVLSANLLAILGLAFTSLFWASNIIVSRHVVDLIPPVTLNFWRWVAAALFLAPWAIVGVWRHRQTLYSELLYLLIFALLGVAFYNAFLYTSAHTTGAMNIAIIGTITPLITFLFSWLLFRVGPKQSQLVGFTLGMAGVLLLISQGDWSQLVGLNFVAGDMWMVAAVLSWALYTVLLRYKPTKLPPMVFLQVLILLGLLITSPVLFWEYSTSGSFQLTPETVAIIIYVGIFPSLLAYLFWNYGVSILGPNTAVVFMYLIPVFTAILSVLLTDETLRWFHIAGQGLVFAGFYFAVLRPARR